MSDKERLMQKLAEFRQKLLARKIMKRFLEKPELLDELARRLEEPAVEWEEMDDKK